MKYCVIKIKYCVVKIFFNVNELTCEEVFYILIPHNDKARLLRLLRSF